MAGKKRGKGQPKVKEFEEKAAVLTDFKGRASVFRAKGGVKKALSRRF